MPPPPPHPSTLSAAQQERRERIVRGAYTLMENGEYEHIQMRDVAEQSDVALATLYRYFASKEHLFAAVLVEWSGSLGNRVERRPLEGDDVAAQLDDLMGRVLTAFERLPQFFRLMSVIETTPDEHARALYDEFNGRSRSTFAVPLRPLAPDDGQAVLDLISAVLGAVLRSWAHGSITMNEVRGRMSRAIRVIFSPPPVPQVPGPVTLSADLPEPESGSSFGLTRCGQPRRGSRRP